MKAIIALSILVSGVVMTHQLPPSPRTIEQYKEIAAQYNENIPALFNALTLQEKIFIYYMMRASMPGNRVSAQQMHRHALELIDLFEVLVSGAERIKAHAAFVHSAFVDQLTIYLVYLWSNHSNYFIKEHVNEKRTPERIGLPLITKENLLMAADILERADLRERILALQATIFELQHEPTLTVADKIEKSAVHFYEHGFTQADYDSLPEKDRGHLNAYYALTTIDGKRIPHIQLSKIGGRFSQENEVAAFWLTKALEHVKKYPNEFDQATVESLVHLIAYLHSGDEEDFKKHSIAWLKTNNRVGYVWGSIETYKDPKETCGSFEADITLKAIDMKSLNELLPLCEKALPFPTEFKRENLGDGAALPNASINCKIFGSGDAGPLHITAAYCLPNYQDIRATHGSKQIIYQADKGLGALLNPRLQRTLFHLSEHAAFLDKHDPEGKLHGDIWNVHCILHETLGHGSGRLAYHTVAPGQTVTIDGKEYMAGQKIQVTPENVKQFFAGTAAALEELRAEIIALHTSISSFDLLHAAGLFKEWPDKIGKETFIEWLIYDMAGTGLRRLQSQPADVLEVSGAHAQANLIIMNYLIDAGVLQLVQEEKVIEGISYQVLDFKIVDVVQACAAIEQLAIDVQRLKSTANGAEFKDMLEKYGLWIANPEHVRILQKNLKAVVGDLKVSADIFPRLVPVLRDGQIVDITAQWPASLIEQQLEYSKLALSKEW